MTAIIITYFWGRRPLYVKSKIKLPYVISNIKENATIIHSRPLVGNTCHLRRKLSPIPTVIRCFRNIDYKTQLFKVKL